MAVTRAKMTSTSRSEHNAFIIGAGFNQDAAAYGYGTRYPLVTDLARECFEGPVDPDHVEEAFQTALSHQPYREDHPLEKLRYLIMRADEKIGPELCRCVDDAVNPYVAFLRKFVSAAFLSFNYDVLLELLLFRLGAWRPEDGFGVPVRARLKLPGGGASCSPVDGLPDRSITSVLHLHGSYSINPREFDFVQRSAGATNRIDIQAREEPSFDFDHYLFPPFAPLNPDLGYVPRMSRVMAPVPDKAEGLKGVFVHAVRQKAIGALQRSSRVAAIGYRFNEHDRGSYRPLLEAIAGGSILVVSPDADDSVRHLVSEHPKISWTPLTLTFAEWAARGFQL
jgi:hypothetical protein